MLGTDIIEIERVRAAAEKESFFRGVFTQTEREYYERSGGRAETLAGMFCAKEAVAKALGCGVRGFRMTDIEITHDESGAPHARLCGKAKQLYPHAELQISIAHCQTYATAVAICTCSGVVKRV